jgi:AraC-like DNA-binding protein
LWKKGRALGDYGLIYIAGGQGKFRSEETGEMELTAGDLLVLFPGVRHRFRPNPETGWTEYWLLFNGHQPDRLFEHEILSPRSPIFHIGDGCPVESLFIEVLDALQAQPSTPNRVLAALAGLILAHAVSAVPDYMMVDPGPEQDVLWARAYLEDHVHEDINMLELAARLNSNFATLTRHFRRATGLTPHQYHLRLRISRAKELLEDPHLRIKQIAIKLGFHDQYYFSRAFKRHTGCSPIQWRKTMGRGLA